MQFSSCFFLRRWWFDRNKAALSQSETHPPPHPSIARQSNISVQLPRTQLAAMTRPVYRWQALLRWRQLLTRVNPTELQPPNRLAEVDWEYCFCYLRQMNAVNGGWRSCVHCRSVCVCARAAVCRHNCIDFITSPAADCVSFVTSPTAMLICSCSYSHRTKYTWRIFMHLYGDD